MPSEVFDVVEINSEHTVSSFVAAFDFVKHPWPRGSLTADEHYGDTCSRKLIFNPLLHRRVALVLHFFPIGSVDKSAVFSLRHPAIPNNARALAVFFVVKTEEHPSSHSASRPRRISPLHVRAQQSSK